MRSLSPEEAELWAKVAATIRPLSRETAPRTIAEQAAEQVAPVPAPPARPGRSAAPKLSSAARPLAQATLDGSWDRKLRSGRLEPDRTLDLHGHDLDSAWHAIDTALERAIAAGDRVLLLITGHARPGETPVKRGRIRAVVHDWLAASRHASAIASVRGAHPRHGGGGSLYIVLRRSGRRTGQ